jgi:hypothetical protein
MIDDALQENNKKWQTITAEKDAELAELAKQAAEKDAEIAKQAAELARQAAEKDAEIAQLLAMLDASGE